MNNKQVDPDVSHELQISALPEGEIGFIVPWAVMLVDGHYYLWKDQKYYTKGMGAVNTAIRRRGGILEVINYKMKETSPGNHHFRDRGLYVKVLLIDPIKMTIWQLLLRWLRGY